MYQEQQRRAAVDQLTVEGRRMRAQLLCVGDGLKPVRQISPRIAEGWCGGSGNEPPMERMGTIKQ